MNKLNATRIRTYLRTGWCGFLFALALAVLVSLPQALAAARGEQLLPISEHQSMRGSGSALEALTSTRTKMGNSPAVTQDQTFRFVITVFSEDTKEPVAGAKVSANQITKLDRDNPTFGGERDSATTTGAGEAWIVFKYSGTYIIKVEHEDYVTTEKWMPTTNVSRDIAVNFSLKRKPSKSKKIVTVNLTGQDNNLPVEGALISLQESFWVIFNANTDAAGKAVIAVTEGDNFTVQISHSKYKLYRTTLRLSNEQNEYSITHQMKLKTRWGDQTEFDEERALVVGVYSQDKQGNATMPVASAKLTFPDNQVKYTDANGRSEVFHKVAANQEIKVDVEARGYKSRSVSHRVLPIDEQWKDTLKDVLSITLEPLTTLNTEGWVGTWVGDSNRTIYTLHNDGDALSAIYKYNLPGVYHANAEGKGELSNCQVKNSRPSCINCDEQEARCDWSGSHKDDANPEKTTTGIAKLFRDGDRIKVGFYTVENGEDRFTGATSDLTRAKQRTRLEESRKLDEYNRNVREGKIPGGRVASLKGPNRATSSQTPVIEELPEDRPASNSNASRPASTTRPTSDPIEELPEDRTPTTGTTQPRRAPAPTPVIEELPEDRSPVRRRTPQSSATTLPTTTTRTSPSSNPPRTTTRPTERPQTGTTFSGPMVCNSFQEEESGWTSVWTRRGNSDVFDASFTGPAGQRGSTVNTVSANANSVTIRRTSSTDGILCTYEGTIQADGTTVEGSYTCTMGSLRKWRASGMICGAGSGSVATPPVTGPSCMMPNVVGRYTLTGNPSGLLVIDSHSGNHVVGRYGPNESSLVYTIEGNFLTGDKCNVLSGTFGPTGHNPSGKFTYTFSGNGASFSGNWRTDNGSASDIWNGTRR